MSGFSENLRRIRFERHMTQEEFATLLGTTKQNISRYESGAVSPKISTAQNIADKLGMTLSELNGQDDDPTQARQELFDDPDRKALLKLARYGTAQEVRQVAALIDALKRTNPDFYDGDDPA